tara:strand:- start:40 stop:504 length:465 start_codon:yes stop_codon:yes gene_type:complete
MYLLIILVIFLVLNFLFHLLLQNINRKNLIKNFVVSFILSTSLFNIYLKFINIEFLQLVILNLNLIFANIVYLIVIQSFRSSIQINILKNFKKVKINRIYNKELDIFNYRINILKKNRYVKKNKKDLIYLNNLFLDITYLIFFLGKKIYNEKFD